jgi:hypothetical protein
VAQFLVSCCLRPCIVTTTGSLNVAILPDEKIKLETKTITKNHFLTFIGHFVAKSLDFDDAAHCDFEHLVGVVGNLRERNGPAATAIANLRLAALHLKNKIYIVFCLNQQTEKSTPWHLSRQTLTVPLNWT